MKPVLFFLLLLLPACSAAPIKQTIGEAVHKRIEAQQDGSVQVCSCQTQCSIAEIPKN